jgi:hypothetical protein
MRPLTEYDPYDLEFTFWKERLHVDENNDYIITMLLSDYCLSKAPKDLEFSMIISRPASGYGNDLGGFYLPYGESDDGFVFSQFYFLRYLTFRDIRSPFGLLYNDGSSRFFSEKIYELNSDIILSRVTEEFRNEYWSSCDPGYSWGDLVSNHPMVLIIERMKSYDLSDNIHLEFRGPGDPHDYGTNLCPYQYDCLDFFKIPTPSFPGHRLDFYIDYGDSYNIISFCYTYVAGDVITEYLYYSFIMPIYICETYWSEMNFKVIPFTFGVGDPPFLINIGFPAIGDEIIYPNTCISSPLEIPISPVNLHIVSIDPDQIKDGSISWRVV